MTGIVLCEISSGLAIEPRQLPDGVTGDDTEVLLVTTGAVGAVEWGFAPPGEVALESGLPPGRSLTNNNDGTAVVSGTFSSAGVGPYVVYAWDIAGQVAKISGRMRVKWAQDPIVRLSVGGGPVYVMALYGGPDVSRSASVTFDPPLPGSWSKTVDLNGHRVIVDPDTGTWHGTVTFSYSEGWPSPHRTSLSRPNLSIPFA